MGWKEFLGKFRLGEIKAEGKQIGGINVNVENKSENTTYNLYFTDPEAARILQGSFKRTPDFERMVKEETERRLINLGVSPQYLSDGTRTELVLATTGASVAGVTRAQGNLTFKSDLDVKVSPASSTKPKK